MSNAAVNYREYVAEVMRRSVRRSKMSQSQFAAALTRELENTPGRRATHPIQVSKWVTGAELPKGDVVLAALRLAGFSHEELLLELDPMTSARGRLVDIEERLRRLENPDAPH
jgi:hypothetical protein